MHEQFEQLLNVSQPPKSVIEAAAAIFRAVWEKRIDQVGTIRKMLGKEIKKIDKQVDDVLALLVGTSNPTVVKAY